MANRQKIIKLSDIEIVNWDIKKLKINLTAIFFLKQAFMTQE